LVTVAICIGPFYYPFLNNKDQINGVLFKKKIGLFKKSRNEE